MLFFFSLPTLNNYHPSEQKNIYSCFTDYAKAFDCVDHKKLENSEPGLVRGLRSCRHQKKVWVSGLDVPTFFPAQL